MSRRATPAIVTLVLSAAAVLGYLSYRWVAAPPSAPITAGAERSLPDALPRFSLGDLEGVQRDITSFEGTPLVINFWATWCAPCLREIPLLKAFQSEHEGDVRVVGIAVDYLEAVTAFAEDMQFNYPVLVGQADGMNAASAFGVDVFALPFTVFTSASGAVVAVRTGEIHREHLEAYRAVVAELDAGRIDVAAARRQLARRL